MGCETSRIAHPQPWRRGRVPWRGGRPTWRVDSDWGIVVCREKRRRLGWRGYPGTGSHESPCAVVQYIYIASKRFRCLECQLSLQKQLSVSQACRTSCPFPAFRPSRPFRPSACPGSVVPPADSCSVATPIRVRDFLLSCLCCRIGVCPRRLVQWHGRQQYVVRTTPRVSRVCQCDPLYISLLESPQMLCSMRVGISPYSLCIHS